VGPNPAPNRQCARPAARTCRRGVPALSPAEFEAVGGFCERYYAAEEVVFARALRRRGQFVIPRAMVLTFNRKIRTIGLRRALTELFRFAIRGPESYVTREGLGLWYGPEAREKMI